MPEPLQRLSRLLNALLGGDVRETVSSRVGRRAMHGKRWAIAAEAAINLPFALLGQRHHCAGAIDLRFL